MKFNPVYFSCSQLCSCSHDVQTIRIFFSASTYASSLRNTSSPSSSSSAPSWYCTASPWHRSQCEICSSVFSHGFPNDEAS